MLISKQYTQETNFARLEEFKKFVSPYGSHINWMYIERYISYNESYGTKDPDMSVEDEIINHFKESGPLPVILNLNYAYIPPHYFKIDVDQYTNNFIERSIVEYAKFLYVMKYIEYLQESIVYDSSDISKILSVTLSGIHSCMIANKDLDQLDLVSLLTKFQILNNPSIDIKLQKGKLNTLH